MKKSAVLLSLLVWIPCSAVAVTNGQSTWVTSSEEERIVQQYTIKLFYMKGNKRVEACSGFISGPYEALSAGHCFDDNDELEALGKGQYFAEAYDPKAKDKTRAIKIDFVSIKDDKTGDLSLLKLSSETPVDQSLPLAVAGCDDDSEFIAAGFGKNEKEQNPKWAQFAKYRKLTTKEIDLFIETKKMTPESHHDPNWLDLHGTEGRICAGDSGGPIFCRSKGKWSLAAINSGIVPGKITLKPQSYKFGEYCQLADILTASRVGANTELIQSWRKKSSGPKGSISRQQKK